MKKVQYIHMPFKDGERERGREGERERGREGERERGRGERREERGENYDIVSCHDALRHFHCN